MIWKDDQKKVLELRRMPFSLFSVIGIFLIPLFLAYFVQAEWGVMGGIIFAFAMLVQSITKGITQYAFIRFDLEEHKLTIKKKVLGLLVQEKIVEDFDPNSISFPKYKIQGKGIQFHIEYLDVDEKVDLWRFKKDEEKEEVERFLKEGV